MFAILVATLLASTPALAAPYGKSAPAAYGKHGATSEVAVGKRLSVASPVVVGDLAVYPLIDRSAEKRPDEHFVSLPEAVLTGQLSISEVSGESEVPLVQVMNRGKTPVLAFAGDVLQGGYQDRVITRDLIIHPSPDPQLVRVDCVEQDRWGGGESFAYAGQAHWNLRRVVQTHGDQGATWSEVALANQRAGRSPTTGTYLAAMRAAGQGEEARRVEAQLAEALADKRVIGVVVARGGTFEGSEIYGHPELFARHKGQVISSHVSQGPAVASAEIPSTEDAADFVRGLFADGSDARSWSLVAGGDVVHVNAYAD